jgi:hypothetical protein
MKKPALIFVIFCLLGLPNLLSVQAQSTENLSNEELRKQNQELKERIKLLEENKLLKAQKDTLEQGTAAPSSLPAKTSLTNNEKATSNATSNTTQHSEVQKAESEVVQPVTAQKNLFLTKNNTVINSACLQQDLEPASYNIFDKRLCTLAKTLVQDTQDAGDTKITFRPGNIDNSLRILLAAKLAGNTNPAQTVIDEDFRAFIFDIENNRNDKQIGSDAKAAGTTSLAVKGGMPRFLSWAIENGAAVGTRNGNTLTFRVNPVGLATNLATIQPLGLSSINSSFQTDDKFVNVLRNFSAGFSFDITRGADMPVFIGSKQQLSAVSVRYNFINHRDPLNPRYKSDWETLKTSQLDPYTKLASTLYEKLVKICQPSNQPCAPATFKNPDLEKWRQETETKLQAVNFQAKKSDTELVEQARQVLVEQLDKLPLAKLNTDLEIIGAINEEGKTLISYLAAKKAIQDKIAKGTIISFEYTNYREVTAPDISNFRFIGEKGLGGDWSLTANASLSFYNKKPVGVGTKRIRDFDFTLQFEKTLMALPFGKPIFSFAGQYQRLPGNAIALDGMVQPKTNGDIATGQFKLLIPIKDTGIKLPFSFTFANRSELIKERHTRVNFGFTFDLDRLLLGRLPF